MWLKMYTNHGQKLELRDYIGKDYEKAAKHADKHSFELIIKDSIHKVDQPGGRILSQNPSGGSLVKENRKIYVDVTKYVADEYDLEDLSQMYGGRYESKKNELSYLDIESNIKGYKQDPGEAGFILEVWYDGKMIVGENGIKKGTKIKKGGTLDFVLSKKDGGLVQIPELVCKKYSEAVFLLPYHRLDLGRVELAANTTIEITIQQEQPASCK